MKESFERHLRQLATVKSRPVLDVVKLQRADLVKFRRLKNTLFGTTGTMQRKVLTTNKESRVPR